MRRWIAIRAGIAVLGCALIPAASADAAQRFAAPGAPDGASCAAATPCSIATAVNLAAATDEVIVAPGDYPIDGTLLVSAAGVTIRGVAGQARPHVHGGAISGALIETMVAGTTVRHLRLTRDSGGLPAIDTVLTTTLTGLEITNVQPEGVAARLGAGVTLSNSTVRGEGAAVRAVGPGGPVLTNVTAWGTGGPAIEGTVAGVTVQATNTIARAPGGNALSSTTAATVTLTNSNFDGVGGGVTLAGAGNQNAEPLLTDPANGDFHQRTGSPTINAGVPTPLAGDTDLDGDARVLGTAPDIGADEYVPRPPTTTTADPAATTRDGGRLAGTVNPNGLPTSYHFEYGPTPLYGSSTAPQDAGAGANPITATADVGGFAPGTLVHYRLVASNADGQTAGDNRILIVPLGIITLDPVNIGGGRGPLPSITNLDIPRTATVGEPINFGVVGSDPDDPVNSILIDFDEGTSRFGASSCRDRSRSRLFTGNRDMPFQVPYTFATPGVHTVEVTLGSGDCNRARQAATQQIEVTVAPAKTRAQRARARASVIAAGSRCANADSLPTSRNLRAIEKATLCLVNEQRRGAGLKPYRSNKRLRKAAVLHNTYMRKGKFFAHQGPGEPHLSKRLRKARYRGGAGENLALGSGVPLATPRGVVIGWMGSPIHRINVLERTYRSGGIAVMAEIPLSPYKPGATYTGEFGTARR